MLAKRIIPCMDIKEGRIVKGVNFLNLTDAGDPIETAYIYEKEGADELVFLDITATHDSRNIMIEMIRNVAERIFIPFTVGGGIQGVEDIKEVLRAGADKVSINSAAFKRPQLIKEAAEIFGSQCVVVAIDARKRSDQDGWEVYLNGGRIPTGKCVVTWAKEAEQLGAGEILLTSMDCDGVKKGYDIELTRTVSENVGLPVIASGGAGNLGHFSQVIIEGNADAVLAASLFHFGELKIQDVKNELKKKGISVRI